MKKWIAFMLILVSALVLYGCNGSEEKKTTIREIIVENNPASMLVGETVQLEARIEPKEAPQTVIWTTSDDKIATVSDTGLVEAVGEGLVEITATAQADNKKSKKVTIKVEKPIVYDDPTSVEITGTAIEFSQHSFIKLVAKVYPLPDTANDVTGALQTVTWSSSDEEIATVDATGKVTGIGIGTATITATVVANPDLTATYDIEVTEFVPGEAETDPTDIQIRGESKVEEGYQIALLASVLPAGVSQNVTWTSQDPEVATVNENGIVTAIKAGTTYIMAASNVDLTITRLHQITVVPEVVLPERKNMQGYTILIMAAGHDLHSHDPKEQGYQGADRTAKLAAWQEVEDLFNVEMKVVPYPDSAPWGTPRINYINEKAQQNLAETDIFVSTTDWVYNFANANSSLDVTEYYNTYGKNAMNPVVKAAATYKDKLYALPTADIGGIVPYHGIFYNYNMLNNLGLDNPAKLFNDGEWTWSRFEQFVNETSAALGENQTVFAGKPAGLFYGLTSAAGLVLVDPTTMSINFTHPNARTAANMIRKIHTLENGWGTNAWDDGMVTFHSGDSLFAIGEYWFVKTPNRWAENQWGDGTTRFGYVPFPYPDNMKKDQTRVSYQGGSIYQMSTGREHAYPSGVTSEDVYRVWTEMQLGTAARMKADPTMNEELLRVRAAEYRLDDPESVKAITYFTASKQIWDPFFSILPSWQAAGPMVDAIATGEDYNSVVSARYPEFLNALQEKFG